MNFFQSLFTGGVNTDLKKIIDQGAFLVDVRTPEEFNVGHVKGSVNIPLHTISIQLAKFNNNKNIIVFCRSGARSGQAKTILQQYGFNNVTNGGTWENVKRFVS